MNPLKLYVYVAGPEYVARVRALDDGLTEVDAEGHWVRFVIDEAYARRTGFVQRAFDEAYIDPADPLEPIAIVLCFSASSADLLGWPEDPDDLVTDLHVAADGSTADLVVCFLPYDDDEPPLIAAYGEVAEQGVWGWEEPSDDVWCRGWFVSQRDVESEVELESARGLHRAF